MKILHTVHDFSASSGGVSSCIAELLQALNQQNCPAEILTLAAKNRDPEPIWSSGRVHVLDNDALSAFGYSAGFRKALLQFRDFDLLHTNGMWMYVNLLTLCKAQEWGIPHVLSPHGMLYPQALHHNYWRKKMIFELFFRSRLKQASCIHATCEEEKVFYRALGFRNPVAVIANPLRLPADLAAWSDVERCKSRVGYLGRFHPRKHIERLIELYRTKSLPGELFLIGCGSPEYEAELRKLAGGAPHIVFTGFLNGDEKFRMLASLTALCVPSDFENFGMIVPEALAVGTPVVASCGTPWQDLERYQCGRWVNNDTTSLGGALNSILTLSGEERAQMGVRGRKLVEEKYEAGVVARKMKHLYRWLIDGGTKPEFVDIC